MNNTQLTKEELNLLREVRIHKILGIPDTGRDIMIRCPFHSERTPSCIIYGNKGYRCFACGKKGSNAIDFIQDLGYTFIDACSEVIKYI